MIVARVGGSKRKSPGHFIAVRRSWHMRTGFRSPSPIANVSGSLILRRQLTTSRLAWNATAAALQRFETMPAQWVRCRAVNVRCGRDVGISDTRGKSQHDCYHRNPPVAGEATRRAE